MLELQLLMGGMAIICTVGAVALYAWDETIELFKNFGKKRA